MNSQNLENIINMFYGCTSLTNLTLDFETQNVKSMKNINVNIINKIENNENKFKQIKFDFY